MSDARPELVIIAVSEAFAEVWPEFAERLGLTLRRLDQPEPVRESRCIAVILSCGGLESHAVEHLRRAYRAGIDAPLVVGAEADHRIAVEIMRRGGGAYFALPGDLDRLESELVSRMRRETKPDGQETLEEFQRRSYDFSAILGKDPGLKDALDRVAKVIPGGRATVLLTGETGTGKELLAHAIHYNGPRAREPFVAVNCSAIPGTLLESELFGHEKGAFTDARSTKPGLFEVADGGTLFLDEVAALPLELQGKLLRALEARQIRRVGGLRDIDVDVRIIAAANVDLAQMVGEGRFREDLYYRLAVVPIHVPPLRERGQDTILLARHFLVDLSEAYALEPPELTPEAIAALRRHRWPGNVRELRNAIERALLLSGGGPIRPEHVALAPAAPGRGAESAPRPDGSLLPFPATLDEIELAAARAAVEQCGGNKSDAARLLGITRSRLYRLLRRAE